MADNVTIPAQGTGDTTPVVATDQLGTGEHVQFVKIMDGTLDGNGKVAADATNGLDVDVTREPATAADAGTLPATTKVISGYDGTNVQVIKTDSSGLLQVGDGGSTLSVDDGAGSLTVDGTVTANLAPTTSGGLSISKVVSAATTNATSVKASAGQVYGWFVSNVNASARYLKLYNKASAPTVGTDTPVMTIIIPGNTAGAGATASFPNGIAFGTGIALALTTEATDAGSTAVAASEIVVNLFFK